MSQVPLRQTLEENKQRRDLQEDSPYSSMMQSPSKAIEKMLKHRLYPEEVAKTVIQAIENPKPKLRYIVGKDAEELIELRRKSSDEEFFRIVGQNILKKEEQVFPQNRRSGCSTRTSSGSKKLQIESVQPFENESIGLFLSLPQFEADPRRTRHPGS